MNKQAFEDAADKLSATIEAFENYLISKEYGIPAFIPLTLPPKLRVRYLVFCRDPSDTTSWGLFVQDHSSKTVVTVDLLTTPIEIRLEAAKKLPLLAGRLEDDAKVNLSDIEQTAKDLNAFLNTIDPQIAEEKGPR